MRTYFRWTLILIAFGGLSWAVQPGAFRPILAAAIADTVLVRLALIALAFAIAWAATSLLPDEKPNG